jgi:hypothetical protein
MRVDLSRSFTHRLRSEIPQLPSFVQVAWARPRERAAKARAKRVGVEEVGQVPKLPKGGAARRAVGAEEMETLSGFP